ncbi:MAG: Malonyl-[acyl-carrier protein] O-methyltransferase [Pseudomonadota bacterium]|jgi:SAM-dependent methyltransferase
MVSGSEWQGRTGDSWAAEWRRTDRSFGTLTDRLLQRSRDFVFSDVLDVGCGAGELSLALARGRADVQVTGVDISPQLVDVAQARATHLPNVRFLQADAAAWQPAGAQPDLLISRHGVMFFADPVAAFANLARATAPGGSLLFSCFREPRLNAIFAQVARLLPPAPAAKPDPLAPGPFAFADPAHVERILSAAGWTQIQFEPFDFAMIAGAGENPVDDAMGYFRSIGPGGVARATMPATDYADFEQRLRAMVEDHVQDGIVAMRAAAWVVSARNGG